MDKSGMSKYLLCKPSKLVTSKRKDTQALMDVIKQGQRQSLAQQELGREWSCLNNTLRQVVTRRLQEEQLQLRVSEQGFVCLQHTECAWSLSSSFHPETNPPAAAVFSNTKASVILRDDVVRKPSAGGLSAKACPTGSLSWPVHAQPT